MLSISATESPLSRTCVSPILRGLRFRLERPKSCLRPFLMSCRDRWVRPPGRGRKLHPSRLYVKPAMHAGVDSPASTVRECSMRAIVPAVALVLALRGIAPAVPRTCQATVAKGFAACLAHATRALVACPSARDRPCAALAHASTRLRARVLAACTEATIQSAGHPPPFDPPTLTARLAAGCVGNAAALVARSDDALGGGGPYACRATLATASARLAVGAIT